jgi:hypothetical protein
MTSRRPFHRASVSLALEGTGLGHAARPCAGNAWSQFLSITVLVTLHRPADLVFEAESLTARSRWWRRLCDDTTGVLVHGHRSPKDCHHPPQRTGGGVAKPPARPGYERASLRRETDPRLPSDIATMFPRTVRAAPAKDQAERWTCRDAENSKPRSLPLAARWMSASIRPARQRPAVAGRCPEHGAGGSGGDDPRADRLRGDRPVDRARGTLGARGGEAKRRGDA